MLTKKSQKILNSLNIFCHKKFAQKNLPFEYIFRARRLAGRAASYAAARSAAGLAFPRRSFALNIESYLLIKKQDTPVRNYSFDVEIRYQQFNLGQQTNSDHLWKLEASVGRRIAHLLDKDLDGGAEVTVAVLASKGKDQVVVEVVLAEAVGG